MAAVIAINSFNMSLVNTTPLLTSHTNNSEWLTIAGHVDLLLTLILWLALLCLLQQLSCYTFRKLAYKPSEIQTAEIDTKNIVESSANNLQTPALNSVLRDCEALTQLLHKNGFETQIKELTNYIQNAQRIFVTGIGKSYIVAQRMAASLSSIGYSTEHVHGAEWAHGDFGKLRLKDMSSNNLVIVFSSSGKTKELYEAIRWMHTQRMDRSTNDICRFNTYVFGVFCIDRQDEEECRKSMSWIGGIVDGIVYLGKQNRQLMNICPTTSVIVQEAFINAVMAVLCHGKTNEMAESFSVSHPGGNIGMILRRNL